MILGAAAIATIIASGVINLRTNNKMLTKLAEKGYTVKDGNVGTFKRAVHDIDLLNLVPGVNIVYALAHNANKYSNMNVTFGSLAKEGNLEKITEDKNNVLKAHSDTCARRKVIMKWRIRERLGLDPITNGDRRKTAGADITSKVKNGARAVFATPGRGWGRTAEEKRKEKLRNLVASADEDTKKMLAGLLAEEENKKGKSK
jgi:hypothetical protein